MRHIPLLPLRPQCVPTGASLVGGTYHSVDYAGAATAPHTSASKAKAVVMLAGSSGIRRPTSLCAACRRTKRQKGCGLAHAASLWAGAQLKAQKSQGEGICCLMSCCCSGAANASEAGWARPNHVDGCWPCFARLCERHLVSRPYHGDTDSWPCGRHSTCPPCSSG